MGMAERCWTGGRQRVPLGKGEHLLAPVLWLQAVERVVEPGIQLLLHRVAHHGLAQQVLQERVGAGGDDGINGVALISNTVEDPSSTAGAEEDLGKEVSVAS